MGVTFDAVLAATARARAAGALFSIETTANTVNDGGFTFLVRKVAMLAKKEKSTTTQASGRPFFNPFLPPDPNMFVCDISPTHVCLLNKFNVVDYHILACTKHFEHQGVRLNASDFAAWWDCVTVFPDGLGFYNCGPDSGASQPHKHMQIAPSSAPVLDTVVSSVPCCTEKGSSAVHRSPILPVRHGFVCLPEGVDSAGLESAYDMLARDLGVPLLERYEQTQDKDVREYPPGFQSFNLLLTRKVLFMAVRSSERSAPVAEGGQGVAINALGYAGHMLTKTDEELNFVVETGPLTVLKQISEPA